MYGIYDTKNNEQCLGIFEKIKDIAKYFNTSEHVIRSTITRKSKRKHRYLIIKINEVKDE